MEELKKVFPNSEIEVKVDNERLTQYGVTIPLHEPVNISDVAQIDQHAAMVMVAMSDGLYISVIIYK